MTSNRVLPLHAPCFLGCPARLLTRQKYIPVPIPIVKAKGSLFTDADSGIYIVVFSSWRKKEVFEQASALEQVIFAGIPPMNRLSAGLKKVLQVLPGSLSGIFYSDNAGTKWSIFINNTLVSGNNFNKTVFPYVI